MYGVACQTSEFTSDSPQISASPHQLDFASYASRSYNAQQNAPKDAWSRHQRLFEANVRKNPKDDGLHFFEIRVQELFMHGEGISTPHARHKGRQPLIRCANHYFFSLLSLYFFVCFFFFCFFMFFLPFMFFTFLWSTRVFPSLLRIPQL